MPMVRRVASSTRRTPMTHSAISQTAGSAIRSAFLCHVNTTYRVAKAETAARAISSTLMFFPFLMGYSRKMHTIIKSQWMLGHSRQQAKAGGIECEKRTDDQQHIRNTPAANLNFGFHSCSPFSKHTVRAGHTARLHRVSIYGRLSQSGPFPGKTVRRRGEGGWRSGWLPFPRSAPWQRAENCGSFPGFHR